MKKFNRSPKLQAEINDGLETRKILKSIIDPLLERSQCCSEVLKNLPLELTKWLQSGERLAEKSRIENQSEFPEFFRNVIYDLVPRLLKFNYLFHFKIEENGTVEFIITQPEAYNEIFSKI